VLLVAAAVAAVLTILLLGRPLTFRADEWAFISDRALADPVGWFAPHGSHFVAAPVVVYRALVETIGLGSYLPYLAVLGLIHVSVGVGVFVAVREEVGEWAALGAAVVLLFLGSGSENLFWAFQIGYVGGIAAGLWGLLAVRRSDRGGRAPTIAAIVLLTIGIASTLTGAVFLAAAWIEAALSSGRRLRRAWVLAVPTAVLGAWWAVTRPGVAHLDFELVTDVRTIVEFVAVGVGSTLAGLSGTGRVGGVLLLVAVASLITWRLRDGSIRTETVGPLVATFAFLTVAGISRGVLGPSAAGVGRYTYLGAVLAMLAIAPLLRGVVSIGAPQRRSLVVTGLVVAVALVGNLWQLPPGRDAIAEDAVIVRAEFALLDDARAAAESSAFAPDFWTPPPPRLIELRARYGDLARPGGGFWDPPPIPPGVLEEVRRLMATGGTPRSGTIVP
jgi:hypothetical protein